MNSANSGIAIVEKLVEVQGKHEFSDDQMADMLGCSRQLYQMARTGKFIVTPRSKIYHNAQKILSSSAEITAENTAQSPQNQKNGGLFRKLREKVRGWLQRSN